MKTRKFSIATALLLILSISVYFSSCSKEDLNPIAGNEAVTAGDNYDDADGSYKNGNGHHGNYNSLLFPPQARMYGKSYPQWLEQWAIWAYSIPLASNPVLDPTGVFQNINHSGPVFLLAGNVGGTSVRSVTIPQEKAIFFPVVNYNNPYPCPDPNFHPAPGETMEHFLAAGAAAAIDLASAISVSLDGHAISVDNFRFHTGLFQITGDPSLQCCFDPCVTGSQQDIVADGYYLMLKPLRRGAHTLHFHAEVTDFGFVLDLTYNINVTGGGCDEDEHHGD